MPVLCGQSTKEALDHERTRNVLVTICARKNVERASVAGPLHVSNQNSDQSSFIAALPLVR